MSFISAKQAILLAKMQAAAGTFDDPANTDWVEITDMTITPMEADSTELTLIKAGFGANLAKMYGHRVKLSFSIALAGSGTAGEAPYWGVLERICGMAQTIVADTSVAYTPADSAFEIGSLAAYIGTNKHALKDARGTSSLEISKGGFLVRKYDITGVYIDPATASIPAVAVAPRVMPEVLLPANTTFSLFGTATCLESLSIDTGFEVTFLQFLACTDKVELTDRKVSGKVVIADPTIATKDWFTLCKNGTLGALAFSVTGAAGKVLGVNAPSVQLMNPTYGESNSIRTLEMDMSFLPAAGSDDYELINT